MLEQKAMQSVERWGVFETQVKGPEDGNPFIDQTVTGCFKGLDEEKWAEGFYDGDGIYRIRFMPSFEGEYHFEIKASFLEEAFCGTFSVTAPEANNHGPVRVANTYHFAYEDGTPYYSIGTTCYVWTMQSLELQEQTLKTLKESAFNKIRFCIFPKHYDYNLNEPISYPYEGKPCDNTVLTKENFQDYNGSAPGNEWDFYRFNPAHFQLFEQRVKDLMELGIEADIIVMHPYDRWGFSEMTPECDDLYWNYIIARLSAYRNVWWSLANEHDLMPQKSIADWERYAAILCEKDPYQRLRSIHNCKPFYDHSRPWITHCSIQRQDVYKSGELTGEWRMRYKKPIVLDEIAYEGNIQHGWGNISAKELIRRFWETTCRGGYAGHGETYCHPDDILWWSHGGSLHGESPKRLKFLHQILSEIPDGRYLAPTERCWDEVTACLDTTRPMNDYFLIYYGFNRPCFRDFHFDEDTEFAVDVIDTWEMTIEPQGQFHGKFRIELPGKEYMAIRIRKQASI